MLKVALGYKDLCSIGIVTPMCYKSAWMAECKLQKS